MSSFDSLKWFIKQGSVFFEIVNLLVMKNLVVPVFDCLSAIVPHLYMADSHEIVQANGSNQSAV